MKLRRSFVRSFVRFLLAIYRRQSGQIVNTCVPVCAWCDPVFGTTLMIMFLAFILASTLPMLVVLNTAVVLCSCNATACN